MFKKLLCAFLSVLMAASCFAIALETPKAASFNYQCGDNVYWYLDTKNKKLTINGTGRMWDKLDEQLYGVQLSPWRDFENQVETIVVEEGVTGISGFSSHSALKYVYLPSTLKYISDGCFGNTRNIVSIDIPEDCQLSLCHRYRCEQTFGLEKWNWFSSQNGPVYLNNVLIGYSGTMPENYTLEIREGTTIIMTEAFKGQTNLTNVVFPGTVEYIGDKAFEKTAWVDSLPDGAIYCDKALYKYNGAMPIEKSDFVVREGTVSISAGAFEGNKVIRSIEFPSSLKEIASRAFQRSSIKEVIYAENNNIENICDRAFGALNDRGCGFEHCGFPEGVKHLGRYVYCTTLSSPLYIDKNINVPASVEHIRFSLIGRYAQNATYSKEIGGSGIVVIDPNNKNYYSDSNGVIYSKDKKILYGTTRRITETYNIPEGVERILEYGLNFLAVYEGEITVPTTCRYIEQSALYFSKINRLIVPDSEKIEIKTPYYSDVNIVYLNESIANTQSLEDTLAKAKGVERGLYSSESLAVLDAAINAVDLTLEELTQAQVNEWENALNEAMANLEYKTADYYAVELAKVRAEEVNQSLYTSESLEILNNAVSSVVYGLNILEQSRVGDYAKAINNAVDSLEYLPADYTEVEKAIQKYNGLNRSLYSATTLEILDQRVRGVEYGLDITDQARVNDFASEIEIAIAELQFDSVVLRNQSNGVIVSGTTKEMNKQTALTVEKRDPSDFECSNFAVGGSILCMDFYDINLIYGGKKVQPNGTVTVKIKLPQGANPAKCRVFHVTDDLVDPLTKITSTLDGNYIVFETTHFSNFAIIEVENILTDIKITKKPDKIKYYLNEPLSFKGLKVVANMSDGTERVVYDYEVSMVDMSKPGEKTVKIYYTLGSVTKSTSFKVNVSYSPTEKFVTSAKIIAPGSLAYGKTAALKLQVNDDLTNYTVKWSSSNEKIAAVDQKGVVTAKGAGKVTITALITNPNGTTVKAQADINCTVTFINRIVIFFRGLFGKR